VYALSEEGRFRRFRVGDDGRTNQLEQLPDLPSEPRSNFAMCVSDDKLFVAGGEVECKKSADVFAYDVAAGVWVEITPLQIPRSHLGLVEVGGRVHAFGGSRDWGPLRNRVSKLHEVYTPSSRAWTFARSMPKHCRKMGVVAGLTELHSVGGESALFFGLVGILKTSAVQVYRIIDDRWERVSRLPSSRSDAGVARAGDHLFVFGGERFDGVLRESVSFHLPSRTRELHSHLRVPRSRPGWCKVGHTLFVFGGSKTHREAETVERRMTNTQLWVHEQNAPESDGPANDETTNGSKS
jgi:hypothetical protein